LALSFSQSHTYCMHGSCAPYMVERFNCQDYTAGMVTELRKYDIESYPALGSMDGKLHYWVMFKLVDFDSSHNVYRQIYYLEPQTGQLIHPSTLDSYNPSATYIFHRLGTARGVN